MNGAEVALVLSGGGAKTAAHVGAARAIGDAGLRGVLPLEAAARLCREAVIAVDVGPGFDMAPPGVSSASGSGQPPILRAHDDALAVLMATTRAAQLALWQSDGAGPPLQYIRPKVERDATFRVDRVRQYAEDGYRAARDVLTRARERT